MHTALHGFTDSLSCQSSLALFIGAVFILTGCRGPTRTMVQLEESTWDGNQVVTCLLGEEYHKVDQYNLEHTPIQITKRWLSVYVNPVAHARFTKIAAIPLDSGFSYNVIRCDQRGVTILEYASGNQHRILYWDFSHKSFETILADTDFNGALPASNNDSLIVEMKDRFRVINPSSRAFFDLDRRDVSGLWSGDGDRNHFLLAGSLDSPHRARLFEYTDGEISKITHSHRNGYPLTAFYIRGEVGHLIVDSSIDEPFIGLYDSQDRLRASIPISTKLSLSASFSVTTVGEVRFISAKPIGVEDSETKLLGSSVLMRCDGWTLTKVE